MGFWSPERFCSSEGFCRSSPLRRLLAAALAGAMLAGCQTIPEPAGDWLPRDQAQAPATAPPVEPLPPAGASPVPVEPLPPPEAPGFPGALPGRADAVRVALLLPLSGGNSNLGRAMLDAAQMALFDLGDERLLLLPKDTEASPLGAAAAAREALAEGAELVLGPLLSGSVAAAAPLARERGVNVISFSTDRSVAGDGVFLLGFTPQEQVAKVVAYARARGLARFAALAPETPYGTAVVEALRRSVELAGGEVSKLATYPPDAADLTGVVRRFADFDQRRRALEERRRDLAARDDAQSRQALRRLEGQETLGDPDFEAVLLPEGGERLKALAPLLPYYDVDPARVRFLGTGQWDEPGLGKEPALVGGWFAAPPPDTAEAFRQRFARAYGRQPPRLASLAYDAVALAAVLAREPPDWRFSRQAIANPNGFAGFDGIFRFGPDGVAERGLAIIEVQPGGMRVVSPGPTTFQALGQ